MTGIAARLAALDLGDVRVESRHVGSDGLTRIAAYTDLVDKSMSRYSNLVVRSGWHHIDRLGQTGFVVDLRVRQLRQLKLGDPVGFEFRVLDVDDKRWHSLVVMRHRAEGWVAAMQEQINICVDFATRRVTTWHPEPFANLAALRKLHESQPWPAGFDKALRLGALEAS